MIEFWLLLISALVPFLLFVWALHSRRRWNSDIFMVLSALLVLGAIPFISIPMVLLLINTGFCTEYGRTWFSKEERPKVSRLANDGATLTYSGSLDEDGYVALTSAVNRVPSRTKKVIFRSSGGSTETAIKLVTFLNERDITALVRHSDNNPDCASACVNVIALANSHDADRDATFMFHVTRLGLLQSYGPMVDAIIGLIETRLDQRLVEHLAVYLGSSKEYSEAQRTEQADIADKLAGKTGSRLRQQIESCPKPTPFESIAGITLTYSEIMAIENCDISIVCPSP